MVESPSDINKTHKKAPALIIGGSSGNGFITLSFSKEKFFYAGKYLHQVQNPTLIHLSKHPEKGCLNEHIISTVTVKDVWLDSAAGINLKLWPEVYQNNFLKVLRVLKPFSAPTKRQGSDEIESVSSVTATKSIRAELYPQVAARVNEA